MLEAQSQYQRIRIVDDRHHPGEFTLYLDDMFQLKTWIEFKYHESLVTMPMCCAPEIDRVLICGGGDGMSLREALKFSYSKPTLVELDPGMVKIFRDMPEYSKFNNNSMSDPRAEVVIGDAIKYMREDNSKYNVICWDFPSPSDELAEKDTLFKRNNLGLVVSHLQTGGVFSTHISMSTSLMVNVIKFFRNLGFYCWVYDCFYDNYGNQDTFLVVSERPLRQLRKVPDSCRWANPDRIRIGYSVATEITPEREQYIAQFLTLEDFEQDDV